MKKPMDITEIFNKIIKILSKGMHERRKVLLVLSCLVVFVTTYMLILPAFTLDKEEAAGQGGIDVPGTELSAETEAASEKIDAAETTEAAEVAEETASPAEESGKESAEAAEDGAAETATDTADNKADESEKEASEEAENAKKETAESEEKEASEKKSPSEKKSASETKNEAPAEVTLTNDDSDDVTVAVEGKDAGLNEGMSISVR